MVILMKKKVILFVSLVFSLYAQDLKTTIGEVISTNPIILERLKNYNATKEDITSAQSGYYPKLDLHVGAGYEKTQKKKQVVDALNLTKSLNVYENSLKYTHNIFNGFSTYYQVKEQEHRTVSAAYSYIEKVNNTAFDMTNAYIELIKNYELLATAKENVDIDEKILYKVQRLYDSGLTTLSEVNKIESSLALAKSNLVVQENTVADKMYNLQLILGRTLKPEDMLKPKLDVILPDKREDAVQFAMKNNPSLLVSDYNVKLAQAVNKEYKSQFYPKIDIEVSGNINKNLSAVEGEEDKFRAMAYVSYNLFNGFKDTSSLQKSVSKIHQEVQIKANLRRKVIEGLNLSWVANQKLQEQLVHLIEYKDFSQKTLTLYSKEYDLGRRSLLDLLSSQNDFIRSKAQIIITSYDLLYAKYRILDAMGILVSTVMNDDKNIYSKVSLDSKTPDNLDRLPVKYDIDNDLIVDERDICDNSLSTQVKDIYGCEADDNNISSIKRYAGFLFDGTDIETRSKERLVDILQKLDLNDIDNLKVYILANAQNSDLNKKELVNLSNKRAKYISKLLGNFGILEKNIIIISNGDEAPMYSSDEEKNNRVDLIFKKLK